MTLLGQTSPTVDANTPIKVLVVDDSAFMRKMVSQILDSTPGITVVGQARDGEDALQQLTILEPDVITLDIEMPRLDGISMLRRLMETRPTPVVMVSSLTKAGAEITLQCLEIGAIDFVCKPSGSISLDIEKVGAEIVNKVRMAAGVRLRTRHFAPGTVQRSPQIHVLAPTQSEAPIIAKPHGLSAAPDGSGLLIIGASTGGPRALQALVPALPANLGVPVVIIQHMPPTFTATLASRLDQLSNIEVREAKTGDILKPNVALVAPGGFHMEFDNRQVVTLSSEPAVHGVRPAVDVTIASLCKHFGKRITAVLLTGMGRDGARGLKIVHDLGGHTIAEHESSCVIYGMPRAAVELGGVDCVLPIDEIAVHLSRHFNCSSVSSRHAA